MQHWRDFCSNSCWWRVRLSLFSFFRHISFCIFLDSFWRGWSLTALAPTSRLLHLGQHTEALETFCDSQMMAIMQTHSAEITLYNYIYNIYNIYASCFIYFCMTYCATIHIANNHKKGRERERLRVSVWMVLCI